MPGGVPWAPGSHTRVAAVIGHPVRHSLSPVLHNAAFRALELDWVYVAFEVPDGGAPSALAGMRALGIEGLSVTMPHKDAVAAAVDRLSPTARALGAVNTVVRRADVLEGHNTDGAGFLAAVRDDEGFDPAGRRCLVLGAGGAARAVVKALADAGAAEVVVVNRTASRAEAAAALAGPVGRVGTADRAADAELIV
ncbi:MAG TPA: shikimate dehydrogenase, partial [Acidimicrobiales bacterium]|nr:shikimate dehydrogenase [Acidimicrobiales bacterium]